MSEIDTWSLVEEGRFQEACKAYHKLDEESQIYKFEYSNWAIALMNLEQWHEAMGIAKRWVHNDPDFGKFHMLWGVCEWFLGHLQSAVDIWKTACDCPYQPLGGGVETVAIWRYGAFRANDSKGSKMATTRLKRFWKKKSATWPYTIAGFLLQEVDESVLLRSATHEEGALLDRQLCQAYFWVGVGLIERGEPMRARDFFQKSAGITRAALLEIEHYLAKWEVSKPM